MRRASRAVAAASFALLILGVTSLLVIAQGAPSPSTATYPAGWNLIAGPGGITISGPSGNLYTWQAGDSTYESIAVGAPVKSGYGYWAYFPTGSFSTVPATTGGTVEVVLPAGIPVLVGNPGSTTALVTGADSVSIYNTLTGQYSSTSTLTPGQGAWATSNNGGVATITNPNASAAPTLAGQGPPPGASAGLSAGSGQPSAGATASGSNGITASGNSSCATLTLLFGQSCANGIITCPGSSNAVSPGQPCPGLQNGSVVAFTPSGSTSCGTLTLLFGQTCANGIITCVGLNTVVSPGQPCTGATAAMPASTTSTSAPQSGTILLQANGSGNTETATFSSSSGSMQVCWTVSGVSPGAYLGPNAFFDITPVSGGSHAGDFQGGNNFSLSSAQSCSYAYGSPGTYYVDVIATPWTNWTVNVRSK
jgi:hypothetical protein